MNLSGVELLSLLGGAFFRLRDVLWPVEGISYHLLSPRRRRFVREKARKIYGNDSVRDVEMRNLMRWAAHSSRARELLNANCFAICYDNKFPCDVVRLSVWSRLKEVNLDVGFLGRFWDDSKISWNRGKQGPKKAEFSREFSGVQLTAKFAFHCPLRIKNFSTWQPALEWNYPIKMALSLFRPPHTARWKFL